MALAYTAPKELAAHNAKSFNGKPKASVIVSCDNNRKTVAFGLPLNEIWHVARN